jgi:hypothetical protein
MNQRHTLSNDTAVILRDRNTGETATTTRWGVSEILTAWYGDLVENDPATADAIADVVAGFENAATLTGSDYLGLEVELAD